MPKTKVFIEDCLKKVKNRFELVMLASHRLEALRAGAQPIIETDEDCTLGEVALLEIASGQLDIDQLKQDLVSNYCETSVQPEFENELEIEEDVLRLIGKVAQEGEEGITMEEITMGSQRSKPEAKQIT